MRGERTDKELPVSMVRYSMCAYVCKGEGEGGREAQTERERGGVGREWRRRRVNCCKL